MADFTTLPIPDVDFESVGPSAGDAFPEITLPDQHGLLVNLHEHRAGRKALVVFHRSADW